MAGWNTGPGVSDRPAVVMDLGSGWTRLGFAGNHKPAFEIPTLVSCKLDQNSHGKARHQAIQLSDLGVFIGDDALNNQAMYGLQYPMRNGVVQSWDLLERFAHQAVFQLLRVDPEDHEVVVTEPAAAPSEGREMLAEIMFETFGVAGLYMAPQPVLALYATQLKSQQWPSEGTHVPATAAGSQGAGGSGPHSQQQQEAGGVSSSMRTSGVNNSSRHSNQSGSVPAGTSGPTEEGVLRTDQGAQQGRTSSSSTQQPGGSISSTGHTQPPAQSTSSSSALQGHYTLSPYQCTGLVVDVGESGTNVVPVVNGFVVRSAVRSVPLGGRDVTAAVQSALRERGGVPPEMSWEVAKQVKEAHSYVCPNPATEAAKWAAAPGKYAKSHTVIDPRAGNAELVIPLGHERFLAPEILFDPPTSSSYSQASYNASSAQGPGTPGIPMSAPQGPPPVPLHVAADAAVAACPIDTRRSLYGSVALAGGAAATKNLRRRLAAELSALANARVHASARAIDVGVIALQNPGHAAWLGGSLIASGAAGQELWDSSVVTRQQWGEQGARVYRERGGSAVL